MGFEIRVKGILSRRREVFDKWNIKSLWITELDT